MLWKYYIPNFEKTIETFKLGSAAIINTQITGLFGLIVLD